MLGPIPQEYEAQSLDSDELSTLAWLDRYKYELAGLQSRNWEGDIAEQPLATRMYWSLAQSWEGFGKEFMPPLDEGSFLYMPTTMPHASIGESMDVLSLQDRRINGIPEVDLAVGKIGRARSPLDPAPISMIETVINYHSEYIVDQDGDRIKYQHDPHEVDWHQDKDGQLLLAAGRPTISSAR